MVMVEVGTAELLASDTFPVVFLSKVEFGAKLEANCTDVEVEVTCGVVFCGAPVVVVKGIGAVPFGDDGFELVLEDDDDEVTLHASLVHPVKH